MGEVRLLGELVCRDEEEAGRVRQYLPQHIELTRSEPGCLFFSVATTADPLVWRVEERFADAGAFALHQQRAASSEWGTKTAGIERQYTIDGLPAMPRHA